LLIHFNVLYAGVPVCNEIERDRDPQQQVFYQTIKPAQASRPTSAKLQAGAVHAIPRPAGSAALAVPTLDVQSIDEDTTTYQPFVARSSSFPLLSARNNVSIHTRSLQLSSRLQRALNAKQLLTWIPFG
jgi:hypothetical protein